MVFVKVRETYDLHTIRNQMSIISIHTPGSNLIKANYPGLAMQCKAYRPVAADVRLACASMLPVDPQGVGTAEGDVAPEDLFNPLLYKAMSNIGMSQLDKYLNSPAFATASGDVKGDSADVDISSGISDDFGLYYGLLAQTGVWKHANPQSGLSMSNLKPLVYETYQTVGDNGNYDGNKIPVMNFADSVSGFIEPKTFRGASHTMPFLNCTIEETDPNDTQAPYDVLTRFAGFGTVVNSQISIPTPKVIVGCIIVPPSRLHQLFYRLVVEWTLEFSSIRPITEITNYTNLTSVGNLTHYMSYSFSGSKSIEGETTDCVDTSEGSGIHKVM